MDARYSNKPVLIVDHQLEELSSLRGILTQIGFVDIDVASSVNMALSLMREREYAVCFVNYDLGKDEKNGLQALHEANHEGILKYVSLFLLVVDPERSDLLFGSLENSPDGYVSKPYDLPNIRHRLDKLLRVKEVVEPIEALLDQQDFEQALKMCRQLSYSFPGLLLFIQRIEGVVLIATGRYEEARQLFESLTEKRDLPWAEVGLGLALVHLGRYENALVVLNRVVDQQQICVEAFFWLGRCHWAMGELSRAVMLMRKAIMLQPTVPSLQGSLADLAAQSGDWKLAGEAYRQAIKFGKYSAFQEPSCYFGLVRALSEQMKRADDLARLQSEDEAIRVLENVVLDHDGFPIVLLRAKLFAGVIYRSTNQMERSDQRLQDAWSVFHEMETSQQCEWLDALVEAMESSRFADDVSECKRELNKVMSTLSWGRANLHALNSFRKGELKESYRLFGHSHRLLPGHIGIAMNLAQTGIELAKRQVGDYQEALHTSWMVLSNIRFGELTEKQQSRYIALVERCTELNKRFDPSEESV